ncbi:UDP-N-acetylmuramoyl-tripeptide--D-alanyl-D-alanine ligase [Croceivirga thetidis]|uniref:UDP-N-acetylmuramoyl-tripeptide--D-alanyl-D-alanine ligase n=1 Tax=Croceivirga thetidis TaxID=2721623 RepID=A0ABX1GWP7_9FLAO|nr:UDP-N-acetylmuramoyl-tripeptide--D-alanyl-D-alanine ligase [Croceivirga thetidis]NKI33300.1 UDP-N-acetylmuramoyl-tripeptide--D-alanyl-D-alanine ligase [Croceivirga thetidis]
MDLTQLHNYFLDSRQVSTDTRKIKKGSLFFALKGPNFNANSFADEALEKGASYAIIDEKKYSTSERTILVNDTLETLQKLANYHRNYSNAKVVSLTGSNGKTTTKELIHQVLSKKYRTIATEGNLNNHIGVPLTLLSIKNDTEIAIVEMGANHQGEIAFLCELAQPDFGYITNFGKAHLEGFGGVEGVIKGKSELYDYLLANDKYVFLNADDPIQLEKLKGYIKKFGFSQTDHQYFNIELKGISPFVTLQFDETEVKTKLVGEYNFGNCAVSVLIGKYFNVEQDAIRSAIESYTPENNRSQLLVQNGHNVVLDAYNANPTSMEAALRTFAANNTENKSVFLGDMFELGKDAEAEHQNIADLCGLLGIKNAYLVGENFAKTKGDYHKFSSFDEFKTNISLKEIPKGDILIKGSRGMAMERILEML